MIIKFKALLPVSDYWKAEMKMYFIPVWSELLEVLSCWYCGLYTWIIPVLHCMIPKVNNHFD